MQLATLSTYHLAALRANQASPHTLTSYGMVERRYIAWIGERVNGQGATAADLTIPNVRSFLDWLRDEHVSERPAGSKRHGPISLRAHAKTLKTWSAFSTREGFFRKGDPLAMLKAPRAPMRVVQTFTDAQLRLMLDLTAATRPPLRNRAILLLLLDTGLRVSELCGINLADVEYGTQHKPGRILVMGKGRKERHTYFGATVAKALLKYAAVERRQGTQHQTLFLSLYGMPLTKTAVAALVDELGKRAGIQAMRCSPHVFRHTFAIKYLRSNPGQTLQLQALLGHASLEMTQHYARLAQTDVSEAYRSVVDLMGGAR